MQSLPIGYWALGAQTVQMLAEPKSYMAFRVTRKIVLPSTKGLK